MKDIDTRPDTRFYKLISLETAIITIRTIVVRRNYHVNLSPAQAAVLLEAARIGAAYIYRHPEILDRFSIKGLP